MYTDASNLTLSRLECVFGVQEIDTTFYLQPLRNDIRWKISQTRNKFSCETCTTVKKEIYMQIIMRHVIAFDHVCACIPSLISSALLCMSMARALWMQCNAAELSWSSRFDNNINTFHESRPSRWIIASHFSQLFICIFVATIVKKLSRKGSQC